MKLKYIVLGLGLMGVVGMATAATPTAEAMKKKKKGEYSIVYPSQPETAERMQWFEEAKFGMFIHWGLYSTKGGISPDGKPQKHGYCEWYQKANKLPNAEYAKLAKAFNPVKFDAEEWVLIAKNAGMKYITITTKHHDGFVIFDSAYSEYDMADATPFGRDPLMELREACDKHGLKLCMYYSHCQDWEQYDAWKTNPWIFPAKKGQPVDHENYLSGKALPQVAELCIKYRADGFWFDTPWFNREKLNRDVSKRFSYLVRALRPEAVINSRISHGSGPVGLHADLFDYISLGDQRLPSSSLPLYAESPDSIMHSYGYDARPGVKYRSASVLIKRMIQTVSRNGNYLLNIGPTGDGEIPQPAQKELKEIGNWMAGNSEAIYGTTANPLEIHTWGEITIKENKLYAIPFAEGRVTLKGLKNKINKAYILSSGEEVAVTTNQEGLEFDAPALINDMPQVVVFECEGVISSQ